MEGRMSIDAGDDHARNATKYVFVRPKRGKEEPTGTLFNAPDRSHGSRSRRMLSSVASDKQIYVKNAEARYPHGNIWPTQMRADMVSAYLDFENTTQLCAAIKNGDAPLPATTRKIGRKLEVVWHRDAIDRFLTGKFGKIDV
jgi:hypothetical protein